MDRSVGVSFGLVVIGLLAVPGVFRFDRADAAQIDAEADVIVRDLHGWTVHVDSAMLEGEHSEAGSRALSMLANHLERISLLMHAEPLARLRKIEIWIEHAGAAANQEEGDPMRAYAVSTTLVLALIIGPPTDI